MVVVAETLANDAAAAPTQLLSKLFGANVLNAKQPDTTATKNARTAKVLATYSSSSGTRQRFETLAHFQADQPQWTGLVLHVIQFLIVDDWESGRGCPCGCEFCTVAGFFGDSIRFRTNESVMNELLLLKARARQEGGQIAVFFIDDNFAINVKRTKSLLRDIIAANAQVHWVAQISANLLRDEELVDLIAAAGGKWIFIGMESIDPANLADVKKGFNKPGEYAVVLDRLARRNVFAITSFIFGMDNDTTGVAERTLKEIRTWPPGLPIFGLMTPLPATPLYKRLETAGRLTRPKHWQEFIPFAMAHTPLKMSIDQAHREVRIGWANSYSPQAIEKAVDSLNYKPLGYRINIFIARLCFRGIYFSQMGRFAWLKTIIENRRTIFKLLRQGFGGGLHAAAPAAATQPVTEQRH